MRIKLFIMLLLGATASLAVEPPKRDVEVLLILGAPGAEEYGRRFSDQVSVWRNACGEADVPIQAIGDAASGEGDDLGRLESLLKAAAAKDAGQLWLVWIGHGTFDGREAKFNLRGPDVSAKQVAEWLKPSQREMVIVQTASASAPFLTGLAGPKRLIVSATKGADEIFYARFGEFFAPAIAGLPEADLDQDRQVSVLEAFLHASKKTAEFYEQEGRLATEHALIEDNGDGIGTRAEIFTGVTANAPEGTKPDGARAAQVALVLSPEEAALPDAIRARRDALETRLDQLKGNRQKLGDEPYYAELEKLLRELSALYANPSSS